VNEFEDIRRLPGGLTKAQVFRIVVRGTPYLLRVDDESSNPSRQFACMKIAGEAGLAPQIRDENAQERILITDFVESKQFPDDFAPLIARTLRKLHSLAHFPKVASYFDTADDQIRQFRAAGLLPENETDELFRRYADIIKVYPQNDTDHVACHIDLKPQNILFDGNRVWLVDWEAARLGDRYVDLAVAANFFVRDEADEENYLREYFGESAGEYRRSRFYLMRQAVHVANATLFLLWAAESGMRIDADQEAPDFRDFHQRIVSGEVDLATNEAKLQYGRVHMNETLRNMRTQQFEDAMARVADFHAGTSAP